MYVRTTPWAGAAKAIKKKSPEPCRCKGISNIFGGESCADDEENNDPKTEEDIKRCIKKLKKIIHIKFKNTERNKCLKELASLQASLESSTQQRNSVADDDENEKTEEEDHEEENLNTEDNSEATAGSKQRNVSADETGSDAVSRSGTIRSGSDESSTDSFGLKQKRARNSKEDNVSAEEMTIDHRSYYATIRDGSSGRSSNDSLSSKRKSKGSAKTRLSLTDTYEET